MYTCPCCGRLTLREPIGSDGVCPVCQWQDDIDGLLFPLDAVGPNRLSLFDAQQAFALAERMGGSDENIRSMQYQLDPKWRRFLKDHDEFLRRSGEYTEDQYEQHLSRVPYWCRMVS